MDLSQDLFLTSKRVFITSLNILRFFYIQESHAFPKDREECRIKATIAQDTNVVYDVDLTPHNEAVIVGPEYYKLSLEDKKELVQAYNCMMGRPQSNETQGNQQQLCINFSLKDYESKKIVATFVNCELKHLK